MLLRHIHKRSSVEARRRRAKQYNTDDDDDEVSLKSYNSLKRIKTIGHNIRLMEYRIV